MPETTVICTVASITALLWSRMTFQVQFHQKQLFVHFYAKHKTDMKGYLFVLRQDFHSNWCRILSDHEQNLAGHGASM